jgi:outer membrane lipoprotein-sorting protein
VKYVIKVLLVQAVLIFSLAFYPLLLHAQDTSDDEAVKILQFALEKQYYKTMQADVVTELKAGEKKVIQEYRYVVKRPDKIKMQITKPYLQTTILSEGIITMKMMDGKIVKKSLSEIPGAANISMEQTVNTKSLEEEYIISKDKEYVENGMTYDDIKFKAKSNKTVPDNMMKIEKKTGKIVETKIFDKTGNIVSDTINEKIENINGINVPTIINNMVGKSIVRVIYNNLKIDEEINDYEFKLEQR